MSDDPQRGQGSIIPTMFVGLGGTGSRIVDRIAARAALLPNWESQLRPLTAFVSIDTNELDQHRLRHVPEANRLNIAGFDKAKAIDHYRRSQDMQVWQWLDKAYRPRPGFKPGAGQIRIESRLGFFYHSPDIRQRLEELVVQALRPGVTWRQSSPPKFNVYFFTTLAGGTGSGAFIPAAYLVDDLIGRQNWQPRIVANLLLSTLMLDKVGPELHADIHANTYAALKEVEHLNKLDYPQVKREGRLDEELVFLRNENHREVTRVATRPFFISFLLDRPPHLGLPDAEAAIADAAYLQIFTPIIDNLASELDNYEKNLEELTRFPGEFRNVGLGYTKNFGAYGAAALLVPAHDLLDYCVLRFAAHAVRTQITFGADPDDPSDDRARALARLAVNYADPKFLNMSDEAREETINRSFVASVQEMARQDRSLELFDGHWVRLVEGVDEGRATGTDEKGEPIRGESTVDRVTRRLDEGRRALIDRISIKQHAFVFLQEGVNQYVEHVSKLLEEIRKARQLVQEGLKGLETAAEQGDPVLELKLDPIAERYLVVRLLDRCANEWIPAAEQQLVAAAARDVSNPKVKERLERELHESLREAAGRKRLFRRDDEAFLAVRDEAQEYYRGVAAAARRVVDAEVALRQLRALRAFLERRSRQYSRLATRMDAMVQELEREAERRRRGDTARVAPLALRVEVFETLDEPRRRMWDQVYRELFVGGGRSLATFDRAELAATITAELKPVVGRDGTETEKSVDQTVGDLRRALMALGERRLGAAIFGGDGRPGLDLVGGLELEARLVLGATRLPGEPIRDAEIEEYQTKKFRALSQLAGVLARVSSAETKALDDGVKVNRTRQLIHGLGAGGAAAAERFLERLEGILAAGGRQVKADRWHDPRLVIVHDVELPIPIYYFEPVTGDVEAAYLMLAADERKAFKLHTDYRWEASLPNLNPRRSEVTIGWSLQTLAEGLVTRVLGYDDKGRWVWHARADVTEVLGATLSAALYRLGEIHGQEDARRGLDRQIQEGREADPAETRERRALLVRKIEQMLEDYGRYQASGRLTPDQFLDKPVLRALVTCLHQERSERASPSATAYEGLRL